MTDERARAGPVHGGPSHLVSGADEPDIPKLWGRRSRWYSRSRWAVAPLIGVAVLAARALGFEFSFRPVLVIAVLHPVYNSLLAWAHGRIDVFDALGARRERILLVLEVLVDYVAMFALIHYTGGVHSPLTLFLVFHVILAALQFSRARAYLFASLAATGLWIMYAVNETATIVHPPVLYDGVPILHAEGIVVAAVRLGFLTITFVLAALLTGKVVEALRRRVTEVADTTIQLSRTNQKLTSLYRIVGSMGMERRIQPILDVAAEQLGAMFTEASVGIAMLDGEEGRLRFVATNGLPDGFPLNRPPDALHGRVLEGETIVVDRLRVHDTDPLRRSYVEMGIHSIVVARLAMGGQPIGTLGLYAPAPDRFEGMDGQFLEMTAELLAIAIEDARKNEAVETLVRDRTRLMLETAHNLRAPLGASMGLLDLVVSGYDGELEPKAGEHLARVVERLQALDQTVGELLEIARSRDWQREIPDVTVDVGNLARDADRTFRTEAEGKGLRFTVTVGDGLPPIESGGDLIQRVLENLISNAIKYTPEGGEVDVRVEPCGAGCVRIVVADTGIGIPQAEQDRLFEEFFRATNAKKVEASGTGLGLAYVKHAVERHRGHIRVDSEEGRGTTVTIDLFARRPAAKVGAGHGRPRSGLTRGPA